MTKVGASMGYINRVNRLDGLTGGSVNGSVGGQPLVKFAVDGTVSAMNTRLDLSPIMQRLRHHELEIREI